MAIYRDMSVAQIAFQIKDSELRRIQVTRYRGVEAFCQLYRFEIELTADDTTVAFDSVVGKAAVLSVETEWGRRWFHGVVSRFELTGETADQLYFRAELVPQLWLLTHRYNSRVFQNKTVQDIVTQVLTDAGMSSDRFEFNLSAAGKPHEYTVQYRETDYNFIARLLEREGIRWHFVQAAEGHKLMMANSTGYAPIVDDPALPYQPPSQMVVSKEHVFRFRLGQSIRPGAVVLRDFDFKQPSLNLQAKADVGRDTGFVFSDYPGEYTEQQNGTDIARLRAEEFESGRIQAVGRSNSPRLAPDKTFDLIDHPTDGLNRSYLVTSVFHQGKQATQRTIATTDEQCGILDPAVHQTIVNAQTHENSAIRELAQGLLQIASRVRDGDPTAHRAYTQWVYHAGQVSRDLPSTVTAAGGNPLEALTVPNLIDDLARSPLFDFDSPVYECRFECIPADVAFRPPRITPWPVMRGSQTARVVGSKGEEIHTDEYGRVKLQFNWDREGKFDDKSSCWVRVSQGFAGGQYGMMFLPRVGQEVVVDFLEGDPNQPIVTGRVYNADHMPPYKLPDEKSKSVIKTSSVKGGGGSNEIRFEDLKGKEQILLFAQKDLHVRVTNDRVTNIDHDDHVTVKENRFELIKKAKNNEIKLDFNEKVGGNKSLEVSGNVGEKFGGNHGEEANNIYLKGGMNVVVEAGVGLTLKVGGNFVKIGPDGVTIMGTMVKINSGGAAGSGTAVSPTAPEAPVDADSIEFGKDVVYSGGGAIEMATTPEDIAGHEVEASWIEVELVDEAGQPVSGEVCEVLGPDGELLGARPTGSDGIVRFLVPEPGTCTIKFPNLDADAWERPS